MSDNPAHSSGQAAPPEGAAEIYTAPARGPSFRTDDSLPLVIVVLIFQRRILAGLTAGGAK
jgi:hypothetical protein